MSKHFDRQLSCSYIYDNGTLFELYEEWRDRVKIGETVDVTYGYAASVSIYPGYESSHMYSPERLKSGRIVFHRSYGDDGILKLAKGAEIKAIVPTFPGGGSEKTKEMGIAVGYLDIKTKKFGKLSWTLLDVISSGLTIQHGSEYAPKDPATRDNLAVGDIWMAGVRVAKVTDLR